MTGIAKDPKTRMAPRLRLLLFGSLALNILVIGIVAGAVIFGPYRDGPRGAHRFDPAIGALSRALNEDDRQEIRKRVRVARDALRPAHSRHQKVMQALITDLRATPFDPDAVAQHMRDLRGHLNGRVEIGQKILLDYLQGLDAAERQAYADRLQEVLNRRR